MLVVNGYQTKKELRAAVGKRLCYQETSMFGAEYKPNGENVVVGPSAYQRKWYATVVCKDDRIVKVT